MNLTRLVKFAGVSGAGLALDYAIYTALCASGMQAGWANLISAGTAVTMVFIVSARHIFEHDHHFLLRPFAVYAAYQVVAVVLASIAVDVMTGVFDGRYLLGKTVIVPVTFLANYAFMSWLLSHRSGRLVGHPQRS